MRRIICSTDDQFLGLEFDETQPIMLDGTEFVPEGVIEIVAGCLYRYHNSNYIFEAEVI